MNAPRPAGLLLAAGAGRRMGHPKALVELHGEPLVVRALRALRTGGCGPLVVVLGAAAERVAALIPEDVRTVVAEDWAEGMGASLRAGLAELSTRWGGPARAGSVPVDPLPAAARVSPATAPVAASQPTAPAAPLVPATVVHLVDLPGVGPPAVARLAALAAEGPAVLARAAYRGVPGHPVLLGREHWAGVAAAAHGDAGARGYLAGHPALRLVECADVADPDDVDTPNALQEFSDRRTS